MKQLAAAIVMVGALTTWASTSRAADYPADNSGKNVRDRQDTALTAGDQSNATVDIAITLEIRKAVMADDELSINGHNVKIISQGGTVTLKGPVKSADEKKTIMDKAVSVAGNSVKVLDQMSVKQ